MIRVLMVLADTDRTDASLSAVDLHGELVRRGIEVRTVALGPGRQGGLATLVPSMAPSTRSIAAHVQLRRESSWADVVVAHGLTAGGVLLRSERGRTPAVVVLGDEWRSGSGPGEGGSRRLGRAAALVATDSATAASLTDRFARAVHLLRFGIDPGPGPTTAAQRGDARRQLALPDEGPVLWWVGGPRDPGLAAVAHEAARRGWPVLHEGGDDDELVRAAADVAVLDPRRIAGPPRELLRAAAAGCALVASAEVGDGELVDDRTGAPWKDGSPVGSAFDRIAEPDRRRDRGAAARTQVVERFALAGCGDAWLDLLGALTPSPSGRAVPPAGRAVPPAGPRGDPGP